MAEEALLENQVTYLYHASAKKLYNLALSSIGDQLLAEQLAIDAFVFAYNRLSDKSDVTQFRIKSARHLYRKTKKTLISYNWCGSRKLNAYETEEFVSCKEKNQIHSLLIVLNYYERFMLLLFLQQRFSSKQVAQILCIPQFIAKKQLYRLLNKAVNIWSQIN
ncbi:hypothetical protein SDC9_50867 [bioreactor metagenome]|uniref:Uncharacterized protein n=1 Tax=bioreactor metagenome TaxID=1076179 RepID=A0A644WLV3_9ZZZZ